MANDDVTITGTTLSDDGQHLHLRIRVHNPSLRTRHLYNSVRALRFDRASTTLEVQMSDHGLAEPRSLRYGQEELQPTNFILPSFTSIDPQSDGELSISLPRTIIRPDVAKSTSASMKFEQLPIHEATTLKVDLAWSDIPYYEDPRMPYDHRQQLVNWTKAVATYKSARKPGSADEDAGQRGERQDSRKQTGEDTGKDRKGSRGKR